MLFDKRLVSLMVSFLLVFTAGCEERKVEDPKPSSFDMLRPVNGSNITDINKERFKIRFMGVGVKLSTMMIELNGVDVTDEFFLNNVSDVAIAYMKDVRNALVQGQNTLIVGQMEMDSNNLPVLDGNGRPILVSQATFQFYLDDIPPRLTVTSVVPTAANPDGSPQTGTTITVEGEIVDASEVSVVRFSYPGGSVNLSSTSNDPVGNNQFNNITRAYRVSLPAYPDISVAASGPHFSYTATDMFEHSRTESFMASGTHISRQKAFQVNESLTWTLHTMAQTLVNNAFSLVESQNILGTGTPRHINYPFETLDPGELMINPRTNCQPSEVVEGVEECNPYGTTRVFIYPSDATTCTTLLFDQSAGVTHCVVFIKNVDLVNPIPDIGFEGNEGLGINDLSAIVGLSVGHAAVDVEVAGIRVEGADTRYLGGLKGIISLDNFAIYTRLQIFPDSNFFFNIDRENAFHISLSDFFKVPKVYGSCNICSPLVSPLSLIVLALGADVSGNGVADKTDAIAEAEKAIESRLGPTLDSLISATLQGPTKISPNVPIIRNERVTDVHTVYRNNAHFVLDGSDVVDPLLYSPSYAVVNGGLGSIFTGQGNYYSNWPWINGWGVTTAGVRNIDLTFAVSANSINQWLLANYQSGMLDDFGFGMLGADISASGLDVEAADSLRLNINPNEAPSLRFISEDPLSSSVCFSNNFLGTFCPVMDLAHPGAVKLVINDVDLYLFNRTTSTVVVDANIDLEMIVQVSAVGGQPRLVLEEDSVRIMVNDMTAPVPTIFSKAFLAKSLGEAIEGYMGSPTFTDMLGPQVTSVVISDLPGMGGSDSATPGPDCDGPSQDGEFCVAGTQVPYSSLFLGALPRDYGIVLRRLTVEPTGSYLSVSLDVREKAGGTWSAEEMAEHFRTLQITN